MPGGDRTGPMGMGPMTGRGAGFCAGSSSQEQSNPTAGLGRGAGYGRGRRRSVSSTDLEQRVAALEAQGKSGK